MSALEDMQHPIEYDPMGWGEATPYYCNECDEAIADGGTCAHNALLELVVQQARSRARMFSERVRLATEALAAYSEHTGWQPTERDAQVFKAGAHMGVIAATKGGTA